MGFFSELKEDLSQAVNELMPVTEDLENAEQSGVTAQAAEQSAQAQQLGAAGQSAQTGQFENAELLSEDVSLEEMLKNIDEIQVSETMGSVEAVEEAGTANGVEEEPVAETDAVEPSLEDMLAAALEAIPERDEAQTDTDTGTTAENDLSESAEQITSEETAVTSEISDDLSGVENLDGLELPAQETVVEEEMGKPAVEQEAAAAIREESKGAEEKMDNYENRQVVDETATITQGMYIRGDIMSEGSADIMGSVEGNIDVLGKLNITGHIDGNSKAAEIYAEGAKINGDIVSEGAVKIGDSSVIIGNITAKSAAIAGAVKGDIDVQGPVILDSSAIVMGNIKSKSVQINNGAVIEGMCSQCYADVSPTSFFDDYKPETKSSKKASKAAEKNNA